MIQEINLENIDDIGPIIDQFKEKSPESGIPDNFLETIKEAVAADKAHTYGAFSENGELVGTALFGKTSQRISFVFANGDIETEKKLVSTLFDQFSTEYSYLVTGGPWLSEELVKHLIDLGFSGFDRSYMTLPQIEIRSLTDSILPAGISFHPYDDTMKDETSKVMFEGNGGHVDQLVFPEFFSSIDSCKRLIENIEANRYGEYRKFLSWILRKNSSVIGACFMTVRNGDTGYVPEIVMDRAYRGQGLGKAILVHSMKRLLESDSSLIKVDLDVTLSNNARFLYGSLGFTKVRDYTIYTWVQKDE